MCYVHRVRNHIYIISCIVTHVTPSTFQFLIDITLHDCIVKPKCSNFLLFKWAVTALWPCRSCTCEVWLLVSGWCNYWSACPVFWQSTPHRKSFPITTSKTHILSHVRTRQPLTSSLITPHAPVLPFDFIDYSTVQESGSLNERGWGGGGGKTAHGKSRKLLHACRSEGNLELNVTLSEQWNNIMIAIFSIL